jgi:hypothetical protein
MTAIVFTGPTLPAADAANHIGATCLPPARQGDLWRAVRADRPVAIGLIDGRFLDVPAVWHREILAALAAGVHVFGAASMGALRAAELDSFGMRGVGRIYAAYRDGVWPGPGETFAGEPFADDDEVAVIHAPIEAGAAALSDAMVDLRATLDAAAAAAIIDRAAARRLAAALKRLHFPERSFARMMGLAPAIIGAAAAARLAAWLPAGRVSQKRLDAIEMLAVMADFLADQPPPFEPDFAFTRALVWERFAAADAARLTADEMLVLDELRLDPPAWRAAMRAGLGRLFSLHAPAGAAGSAGSARPAGSAARAQLDRFRHERGLARWRDIAAWMDANALTAAGLSRLLADEAALDGLAAAGPPGWEGAALDHLRLEGGFAARLARARAKAHMFARAPPPASVLESQAALAWYAENRLGQVLPDRRAGRVPPAGWASEADFAAAVWREYLFSRAGEG